MDMEDWKRSRSESSTAADELESTYMPHKVCINMPERRSLHSVLSTAQGGLKVTVHACIPEVLGSMFGRVAGYLD
jgi:hypothetical protein